MDADLVVILHHPQRGRRPSVVGETHLCEGNPPQLYGRERDVLQGFGEDIDARIVF